MLLDSISLTTWYYIGVLCGLIFMMVYQYWLKYSKDPELVFDKKYLVPFLISLVIAVFQLLLELVGIPVPVELNNPWEAFYLGFIFWAGVQEILKAILKLPQIDYFNTAS